MALIRCDFWSEALEMSTSMTVILPDGDATDPPPVLYLLHGLTDDHTAWTRFSSVERYAEDLGLAVVMPSVDRSFYANEAYGMRFWDLLSAELPERVGRFFRVSARREDTFVAGLSMGGYGAVKWALREPERFAAAATLSGALDLAYIQEHDRRPHIRALVARVFADRIVAGGDEDLMHLIRVDAAAADAALRQRRPSGGAEPPVRGGVHDRRCRGGRRVRAGRPHLGVLGPAASGCAGLAAQEMTVSCRRGSARPGNAPARHRVPRRWAAGCPSRRAGCPGDRAGTRRTAPPAT
jgi:putative tributyrin esterase